MKKWQIVFECTYHCRVTYACRAKNYQDAHDKFERKYGTIVGDHRILMGHYEISEIKD